MSPGTIPSLPRHRIFSPTRIAAIASNTLLELVRQKVFYFLLLFGFFLIGASFFMTFLRSEEMQFQVMHDASLGAMSVFTWLLAVLSTAMLLPKEIEDRTLYTILAKPVHRLEYLLGKLGGVFLLLALSIVAMSLLFLLVLWLKTQSALGLAIADGKLTDPAAIVQIAHTLRAQAFSWALGQAIVAIFFKAAIIASLTLLLSTLATSWIFTIVTSVCAYLIGYLVPVGREFLLHGGGSWLGKTLFAIIALVFPDFQLFDLADDVFASKLLPPGLFLQTLGLGAVYIVVYTALAYGFFAKKEL